MTHCVQFDLSCADCEEDYVVVLPHKETFGPDIYTVECFICGGLSEVEAPSPELVGDDDGFWEWKPKGWKGEAKKADKEEDDDTLSGGSETLELQTTAHDCCEFTQEANFGDDACQNTKVVEDYSSPLDGKHLANCG